MRKINFSLFVIYLFSGLAFADDLADANKIMDYGEANYPQYFSPAGARTLMLMGYYARSYSGTGNYLGIKDGFVYVYGDEFGGLLNVGTTAYYLNLIDGSGGQPGVNLTGRWVGTGSSTAYPGCTASVQADVVQSGDQITGSGQMSGACLGGTDSGQITGTVSGNDIAFGIAFDTESSISYQGQLSADGSVLTGTYDWPDEDDKGNFSLQRQ